MTLSAPIFRLKRRARRMARDGKVPLHEALDRVAREEGFPRWSLLSSHVADVCLPAAVLARLDAGDLFLLAGRPGHGKTTLGLRLLLAAARRDGKAVLFSLELSERQARDHIRSLGDGTAGSGEEIDIVTSDAICADFIVRHLAGSPRGTVALVDYLQILDQQRSKPALSDQIAALSDFARTSGVILGFVSQIDRSFDPRAKRLPDIHDLRLPNLVDLSLFNKACFLHDGEAAIQNVA